MNHEPAEKRRRLCSSRAIFVKIAGPLALVLFWALASIAQPIGKQIAGAMQERRTARYFESIRNSPPQQLAFLLKMPKGGDLHSHLSGAIYAESYIEWAADSGLCVNNETMALSPPP